MPSLCILFPILPYNHRISRESFYYDTSILRNMWKILIHHAYFTSPTIRCRRVLKTFYLLLPNMFFESTLKSHYRIYTLLLFCCYISFKDTLFNYSLLIFVGYNFRQLNKTPSLLMVKSFIDCWKSSFLTNRYYHKCFSTF